MSDIIDINVEETIEEITINVVDNVIQVNINKVNGGGAVDSVNGQIGVVVLDQDDIADGTTYKQYSLTEKNKLAGIAVGAEVNVNADWNAVSGDAQILNKPTIPDVSTLVPYTGATTNVDLGTHSITAKDLIVTHSSGSGDAATITKGGNGEALKVSKTSGSGNAASIIGGVTLLDELHLNTDLADSYIASASVWNAKQNAVAGVSDTEIGYLDGVTSAIQTQLNARCQSLYNLTSQITHTGTTAKTLLLTYYIPANTFTNGDFLNFSALVTKAANIGSTTHTIETNTTNTLTGATIISTAGFNTTNSSMKFKREIALTGGNGYVLNISNNIQNDQTLNAVANTMPTFIYNLAADLYLFVTCQLTNATDSITYRGLYITKN